jgi:hypothetical protein
MEKFSYIAKFSRSIIYKLDKVSRGRSKLFENYSSLPHSIADNGSVYGFVTVLSVTL